MTMSIDGAVSAKGAGERVSDRAARAAEKSKALLAAAAAAARDSREQGKSAKGDRVESSAVGKAQSAYDAQGRLVAEQAALKAMDQAKEAGRKLLDGIDEITRQTKAMRSSMSSARKDAAKERISRIKQQLQSLRAMAAADPKGTAKRVAQLARELASAAKEYASAGGGTTESAVAGASATPAAGASAATGAASATPGQGAEGASAGQAEAPAPEPEPAPAAVAEGAAPTGEASGTVGDTPAVAVPGTTTATTEAKSAASTSDSDKASDASFKDEVKRLLREMKALYELAKRLAHRRGAGEREFAQDDKDMQRAALDVAGAVSQISAQGASDPGASGEAGGIAGEGGGVDPVASADLGAAPAVSTVSIVV